MPSAISGSIPYCIPSQRSYSGGVDPNPDRKPPEIDPKKKFLKKDIETAVLNDRSLSEEDKVGVMKLLLAADLLGDRDFNVSLEELRYAISSEGRYYRNYAISGLSSLIGSNPSDECYLSIIQHHMSRLRGI